MVKFEGGLVLLVVIAVEESSLVLYHLTLVDVRRDVGLGEILLALIDQVDLVLAPLV